MALITPGVVDAALLVHPAPMRATDAIVKASAAPLSP
jgi:hypothetical protein